METNNTQIKNEDKHILTFIIEGKTYHWHEQFIMGFELKKTADIPLETELFLSINEPWKDELVRNEDKIDLARPGLEYFYVKKSLKFVLDGKEYEWGKQYISGIQLKKVGDIPNNYELFLHIHGPWEDELIKDLDNIDLARPGIEHFYSKEVCSIVSIKINNTQYEIKSGNHNVSELKKIGNIPSAHELEQLINGKLTPLDDNANINIVGGEEYISHVRDGSSSFKHELPGNQIDELKTITSSCSLAEEGGYTYIYIKKLQLPEGCVPGETDALLCPFPREGYESRLFFSDKVSAHATLNWNSQVRILDRSWHAFSWKTKSGLRIAEMLIIHINALRKK